MSNDRTRPSEKFEREDLVGLLEQMIAARHWSTRCFNLQRQGRAGTVAPIDGQEAVVVGAVAALDPAVDWVVPQYREVFGLEHFGPAILEHTILYFFGHPDGSRHPDDLHVFPVQIALAAQIPQAAGLAWGLRRKGRGATVLCFFGDGSASEGDAHEGMNLAAIQHLPVVFLCVNNGWAISTPASSQTVGPSFAARGAALGMASERIDGNDVLAVYDAVSEARDRARAGEGPTLLEAITYRLGPHTTADDPTRYVPADELEHWRKRDPITKFASQLRESGWWDDERHAGAVAAADARFDEALAAAESRSVAPDSFFDHTYAVPFPELERQRRELLDELSAHS